MNKTQVLTLNYDPPTEIYITGNRKHSSLNTWEDQYRKSAKVQKELMVSEEPFSDMLLKSWQEIICIPKLEESSKIWSWCAHDSDFAPNKSDLNRLKRQMASPLTS